MVEQFLYTDNGPASNVCKGTDGKGLNLIFGASRFGGKAPAPHAGKGRQAIDELSSKVAALLEQYVAALEGIKIRDAIKIAMQISAAGNKFMQVSSAAANTCFHWLALG